MNAQDRRQRPTPRRHDDVAADVLASLVRAAPVAIVGHTLEGRVLVWNPAAEALFGYRAADVVGQSCSLLIPPDRVEEARSIRTQLAQGRTVTGIETVRLHQDERRVAVLLDAALVPTAPGEAALLCVMLRPLPREPRAAPAADRDLLSALAASGAGAFRCDIETNECKYDQTFACLWELPRDQATSAQTVLSRIHPDDLPNVHVALNRSTREGTDFELEHRVVQPSGDTRWLLSKGKTFTDSEGRLRRMTGVSVDITHRRRAEEALRQSEERFRGMAEAIPSIVWETDAEGRTLYKNRVWFQYTGQGVERVSQEDWLQFYHPDDREALRRARQDSARPDHPGPFDIEARIRRRDGVYRWFRIRGAPIPDAAGTIVRWAGTCTDIDDQRRAAQALEEADRHKNEFLAMLAHELRNPLASIRNAAEIVRISTGENQRLAYALEIIGRQTERLGRLIADLLDLSNISRGRLALQREPCDLLTVVREALDLNRGAIERKRQELELQLTERRLLLLGDASRLVQLVSNLIDNAMKYTPEGGRIEVAVRREGDRAVLDVRDTGVGIPPELLPHVFDLFVQGERPAGRADGGLGIGLALVKEIAAMHGGSVTARSRGRGQGAQFALTLPLLQEPAADRPPEAGADRAPAATVRRVLIVDDNRDYADSLAMLLQHLGHHTLTLYSAAEALARARAFAPDIALLDIGLPDMEGGELCRRLRHDPQLAGAMFVAISGFGQDADRARTRAAGFAHHLLKPVRLGDLLPVITGAGGAGAEDA